MPERVTPRSIAGLNIPTLRALGFDLLQAIPASGQSPMVVTGLPEMGSIPQRIETATRLEE